MAESRVGLIIEQQRRGAEALGQAALDVRRYGEEIKKLTEASKQGSEVQAQLGQAMMKHAEATRSMRAAMNETVGAGTKLRGALLGVTEELGAATGRIGQMVAALGPAGLAIAAVAGAAVIGTKTMLDMAHQVSDYQERLVILSATLGFTTAQLAGMKVAAAESGRSFESAQSALSIFSRHLGAAKEGSEEAQKAFAKLGVSITTGDTIEAGEALRLVAERLNSIEDPALRGARAFALFGRGAATALPIITANLDAVTERALEMGLAFDEVTEKSLAKLDSGFDRIKTSMEGINRTFQAFAGVKLEPLISQIAMLSEEIAKFVNSPEFKALLAFGGAVLPRLPGAGKGGTEDLKVALAQLAKSDILRQVETMRAEGAIPAVAKTGYSRAIGPPVSQEMAVAMANQALADQEAQRAAAELKQALLDLKNAIVGRAGFEAAIGRASALQFPWHRGFQNERGAFSGTPMAEGEVALGGDTFTELDQFLARFEDFEEVFKDAKNATGDFDATLVGFTARMKETEETALQFGQTMADLTRDVAFAFGETMGDILASVVTGLDRTEDAFMRFMRILIQAAKTAATGLIKQQIPGVGGDVLSGIVTGIIGGLFPFAGGGTIVSGVKGADTVPGRLRKNETVIDDTLTTGLQSLVPALRDYIVRSDSKPHGGGNLAFHFHGNVFDKSSMKDWIRREAIPEIRKAQRVRDGV